MLYDQQGNEIKPPMPPMGPDEFIEKGFPSIAWGGLTWWQRIMVVLSLTLYCPDMTE